MKNNFYKKQKAKAEQRLSYLFSIKSVYRCPDPLRLLLLHPDECLYLHAVVDVEGLDPYLVQLGAVDLQSGEDGVVGRRVAVGGGVQELGY